GPGDFGQVHVSGACNRRVQHVRAAAHHSARGYASVTPQRPPLPPTSLSTRRPNNEGFHPSTRKSVFAEPRRLTSVSRSAGSFSWGTSRVAGSACIGKSPIGRVRMFWLGSKVRTRPRPRSARRHSFAITPRTISTSVAQGRRTPTKRQTPDDYV